MHLKWICCRLITSAPKYASNKSFHEDLYIINSIASKHYKEFNSKLPSHINPRIPIQRVENIPEAPSLYRLKRRWLQGPIKSPTVV